MGHVTIAAPGPMSPGIGRDDRRRPTAWRRQGVHVDRTATPSRSRRSTWTSSPDEFVSLIGPSGCGKSTLLRIVGDLIAPSAGTVEVNGKPAHQARLDRDYGMVFQAPVLFDWRTVEANVRLPLEVLKVGRARAGSASARDARPGGAGSVPPALPTPAVGWHAAAGRHRARADARAGTAADGRAVRRPRRDDP